MELKNLYEIKSLLVCDSWTETTDWYIYAENDQECYNFLSDRFLSEDKDAILENKGEIDMVDDNYDGYYESTVYWWELLKENITKEDAEKIVLENMLAIIK